MIAGAAMAFSSVSVVPTRCACDASRRMDDKRRVKVSKYLSKHLRHEPERLGLTLGPGGWVAVDDLLRACADHNFARERRGAA